MTFQPPPPPPGNEPPPPPPGQWNPPPSGQGGPAGQGGSGGFDPKSVNQLDWALLGIGVLTFIFGFISYYSYSGKGGFSGSDSEGAWSGGFFGWFAILLVIVATAVIAVALFAPQISLPVPARVISTIAYGVALLSTILALFVVPDLDGGGPGYDKAIDEGHGFGYWATLVLIIGGTALSLMRAQQTNTALPGPLNNLPKIGK